MLIYQTKDGLTKIDVNMQDETVWLSLEQMADLFQRDKSTINILKEYIKKGFAMDDDRLKELGGGGYFKELLERIHDIRASEKVFYRQVLEIYATSVDYNPTADVSVRFFKRVQNKIHYAVSGETAAEVIYHRADAEKDFMGLMTGQSQKAVKRKKPHSGKRVWFFWFD